MTEKMGSATLPRIREGETGDCICGHYHDSRGCQHCVCPIVCANCGSPLPEHCKRHAVPCCPGRCDV